MPTQEYITSEHQLRHREHPARSRFSLSGIVGISLIIMMLTVIHLPADATFCRSDSPDLEEHRRSDGTIDSLAIASDIIEEAMRGIQGLYIDSISADDLLEAAFAGIRERLDPHTKFLTPAVFEGLMSPTSARADIGVVCDFSKSIPRVKRIIADSPAAAGGPMPGDRLLAVNGRSLAGIDSTQVYKWLRGEEGSTVTLQIEVPGETVHAIDLTRAIVGEQMLSSALIENGSIGYLRIRRFSRGIAADCEQVLRNWQDRNLAGMIIDLRDNPGGFLDEAVRAADLWLPPNRMIVVSEGRAAEESSTEMSYRQPLLPMVPVTILIDSLTASSAEIFAGALQGGAAATLIGEESYGKRTVQRIKRLPGGGALKVTSAVFYTPADNQQKVTKGRARDMADITGLATTRSRPKSMSARGERLQPDLQLSHTNLPAPWNWISQSGYLARFQQEETCRNATQAEVSQYWNSDAFDKATLISRACGNPRAVPGFQLWLDQFEARLSEWGVVIDPIPANGSNSSNAALDQLRYRWLADWADEQWGESAGIITAISADGWVRTAIEHLQRSGQSLHEYTSISN